jgi:hypothetical protein
MVRIIWRKFSTRNAESNFQCSFSIPVPLEKEAMTLHNERNSGLPIKMLLERARMLVPSFAEISNLQTVLALDSFDYLFVVFHRLNTQRNIPIHKGDAGIISFFAEKRIAFGEYATDEPVANKMIAQAEMMVDISH